jgi:hypothetical protein
MMNVWHKVASVCASIDVVLVVLEPSPHSVAHANCQLLLGLCSGAVQPEFSPEAPLVAHHRCCRA